VYCFLESQEERSKQKVRKQNACRPYVNSLTWGPSSWPQPADHRCRWPSMLVTGLESSARYPGAMVCWHLYTWMHSLNQIRMSLWHQEMLH